MVVPGELQNEGCARDDGKCDSGATEPPCHDVHRLHDQGNLPDHADYYVKDIPEEIGVSLE